MLDATKETEVSVWSALNPRRLHLTILPTESCNFGCVYCYEDHKPGRMDPSIVSAIKNHLTQRSRDLDELEISWFGGEPLLAPDIIEDITLHASSLAQECGFKFSSNATTNGYLLNPKTASQIISAGVTGFQISLDGPSDVHDKLRPQKGSKPSFSRIWENLIELRNTKFKVDVVIRVHFAPVNRERIEELIKQIGSEFGNDSRFRVFFKSVSHLGSENDETFKVCDEVTAGELVNIFESKALDLGVKPFRLTDANEAIYVCYAAALNAYVIRTDGRITKCTVDLYSDNGIVGKLELDGSMSIEKNKLSTWVSWVEDFDKNKMSCPKYAINRSPEPVPLIDCRR